MRSRFNANYIVCSIFLKHTKTWLSPKGNSLHLVGMASVPIKKEQKSIHPSQLLRHSLVDGSTGKVQPDTVQASSHHWSGCTQDPWLDSTASSGVPPGVPDPPSYDFESVDMPTFYQSYYPISHIILLVIIGQVTPEIPKKTPLLPAKSHWRCPIPLCTASKAWI